MRPTSSLGQDPGRVLGLMRTSGCPEGLFFLRNRNWGVGGWCSQGWVLSQALEARREGRALAEGDPEPPALPWGARGLGEPQCRSSRD